MRILILILLLAASITIAAQKLPADFAAQTRILPLGGADIIPKLDSLRREARSQGVTSLPPLADLFEHRARVVATMTPTVSMEQALLADLAYLQQNADDKSVALAQTFLSYYYWRRAERRMALEFGLKAYQGYSQYSGKAFPLKHFSTVELASYFYYYHDFDNARRLLQEALGESEAITFPPDFNLLNTIGLCYRETGKYDSAAFYFRKAFQQATAARIPVWQGIINGNLGITAYYQGLYDVAIPLLQQDIALSEQANSTFDNRIKSMSILGEIFQSLGRTSEAHQLLESANTLLRERGLVNRLDLICELYPRLARLKEEEGDPSAANILLNVSARARDSFHRETNALVLAGAQAQTEAERHAAETSLLQQKQHLAEFTRNALIVGIVLLAAIAMLFFSKQSLRYRFREEQAKRELEAATLQLDLFTHTIQEKNELIERISAARQTEGVGQSEFSDEENLSTLRHFTILTEKQWDDFQLLFDKVHRGYLYRLRTKLPGLSPADTRFVALTLLRLSNKEIAAVLGIGLGSVRVTRSRLRRKLALAEDHSLESVIYDI
jgi:tetratricopeptide (TPR) repeat protein